MANNTSTTICPNMANYDTVLYVTMTIWHSFALLCTLFGVPGHAFQILIMFNRKNRKEPTSLYYVAIALCETIFLLGLYTIFAPC